MSFDRAAFADKIRRSMEHLGVDGNEVIASTGIPEARFSILQSGSADPTGDEVLILADYFDCDYKFFISNERLAAFEETDSLYRKHGDLFSKSDRRAIQQFLYLCECESWLWKVNPHRSDSFDFRPQGTNFKKQGYVAASELRVHFGYRDDQIPSDLFRDLRKLGIHLFRRKLENSGISGVMIRHPEAGRCILVNYDEDVYRQRFTAAHELAHALMEDSEFNVSLSRDGSNLIEVRANAFASHYLIPPAFARAVLSRIATWNNTAIIEWSKRLKVSTEVLRISLKEHRIIDDITFNQLKGSRVPRSEKIDPEIASETGRTRDRKLSLLQRGLSMHYVNECLEALDNGVISHARAAEMLMVREDEMGEIKAFFTANGAQ
jgi:Zn-dependent peptidase ImmA (M78 family)